MFYAMRPHLALVPFMVSAFGGHALRVHPHPVIRKMQTRCQLSRSSCGIRSYSPPYEGSSAHSPVSTINPLAAIVLWRWAEGTGGGVHEEGHITRKYNHSAVFVSACQIFSPSLPLVSAQRLLIMQSDG